MDSNSGGRQQFRNLSRSTIVGLSRNAGAMSLMATFRPRARSLAKYTAPMAPRPSSRMISKSPAVALARLSAMTLCTDTSDCMVGASGVRVPHLEQNSSPGPSGAAHVGQLVEPATASSVPGHETASWIWTDVPQKAQKRSSTKTRLPHVTQAAVPGIDDPSPRSCPALALDLSERRPVPWP